MTQQLCIYRWADAPKRLRDRFPGRQRRAWIAQIPMGRMLGPTHWIRRLDNTVEKACRDGSTLVAGNEPKTGEMN